MILVRRQSVIDPLNGIYAVVPMRGNVHADARAAELHVRVFNEPAGVGKLHGERVKIREPLSHPAELNRHDGDDYEPDEDKQAHLDFESFLLIGHGM